jgi:hypothetical protein
MNRIKNLLLCVVLLALAGILHHEWTQMTGSSGIEPEVRAATLSNAVGSTCVGTCTWHFVNNQTNTCQPITAYFTCDGNNVTVGPVAATTCLNSTDHYYVTTTQRRLQHPQRHQRPRRKQEGRRASNKFSSQ